MSAQIDFQAGIASISRILAIGEDTTAATECAKLCEQALRQVVSQYEDRIDKTVRQAMRDAARKRTRGGLEKLTMGQMVNVYIAHALSVNLERSRVTRSSTL